MLRPTLRDTPTASIAENISAHLLSLLHSTVQGLRTFDRQPLEKSYEPGNPFPRCEKEPTLNPSSLPAKGGEGASKKGLD